MLNRKLIKARQRLLEIGDDILREQASILDDQSYVGEPNEFLQDRREALKSAIDYILKAHGALGRV